MELRQLRYFVGASEAGSLLKASAALHVAQPALSQQIAALEAELGARLFERSSRGVTLTDAGKTFLGHARLVLADVDRARMAVRDDSLAPQGDVVVGLPTTVAWVATVPILRACRTRYPQVRLKLVEAYSGHLREWLLDGRLDIAVLYGDAVDASLAKRPLLDDGLVLVTGMQGPRPPKKLALAAAARYGLILPGRGHGLRRIVDEACTAHGIALDVVAEIEALNSVKKAVADGLGATILSPGAVAEDVARGRLRATPIERPTIVLRVVCATNVARPATPAAAALVELITGVMRGMVDSGEWPARWVGEVPGIRRDAKADPTPARGGRPR